MNQLRITILFAAIFTFLFYQQAIGLNLFIFELILLGYLGIKKELKTNSFAHLFLIFGTFISSILVVIINSQLSIFTNLFLFLLLIGSTLFHKNLSMISIGQHSFLNIASSQMNMIQTVQNSPVKNGRLKRFFIRFRYVILPILLVILFLTLYRLASPQFSKITDSTWNFFAEKFENLFQFVTPLGITTFVLGLIISTYIIFKKQDGRIYVHDDKSQEELLRNRSKGSVSKKMLALKHHYNAGIFLFIALNILLLILNFLDIKHIWFSFEWNGQYLKSLVHQGTYALIFAIIISLALIIYFFNGNINFLKENKFLKVLCTIWLFQNLILTISVVIRNWYYITYFGLAYKRIAVMFFLILVAIAIYSIFRKIWEKKNHHFLLRINSFAFVAVLFVSSFFNWDVIIAKYNFNNSDRAFVELNFMASLSDNSIPYLEKSQEELSEFEFEQENSFFKFDSFSSVRKIYMSPTSYKNTIDNRKRAFLANYPKRSWLSWNWSEHKTYQYLSAEK